MHLERWNIQILKNKHEIIIKSLEELKLDTLTNPYENKKEGQ
jgi:hypothetical protein